MTDEEVEALSYDERCRLLNLNPATVAKHFQYGVETFFTEIVLFEISNERFSHLHALI